MKQVSIALAAAAATAAIVSGADSPLPTFVDVARQAGVVFHHTNGASAEKHIVETMGSGGVFFDYDDDGWIDIFLVDGGSIADPAVARRARHRLYHNRGNGTPGAPDARFPARWGGARRDRYTALSCDETGTKFSQRAV